MSNEITHRITASDPVSFVGFVFAVAVTVLGIACGYAFAALLVGLPTAYLLGREVFGSQA